MGRKNQHVFCVFLFCFLMVYVLNEDQIFVNGQEGSSNCTRFYRNIQRSGGFLAGQLTIPVSNPNIEQGPGQGPEQVQGPSRLLENSEHGFKLQIKFSKAIRSVHVRRASGTEMSGSHHTEYMIDTRVQEGKLKLNTMIRLRSLLGQMPRVTRIIFNDKAVCGAPLSESEINNSIIVDVAREGKPKPDAEKISTSASPHPSKNNNDDLKLQSITDDEYFL